MNICVQGYFLALDNIPKMVFQMFDFTFYLISFEKLIS